MTVNFLEKQQHGTENTSGISSHLSNTKQNFDQIVLAVHTMSVIVITGDNPHDF